MYLENGVTVYCLAFNHEQYIGKTLQGFLEQEVSIPFHVIVHDDASTDGTRQVIQEYVSRRPELFTVILQEENQYSKKIPIYNTFIEPRITTKYCCICEGDDYWSDPHKIQLQYEYLEAHPECSMCVHNTERIDADGNSLRQPFSLLEEDRDYTAADVIEAGPGGLFHTTSYMYRTEQRKQMPDCYAVPDVGDYPLSIFMSTQGHIHYIAQTMSMYRVNAKGSWSLRVEQKADAYLAHLRRLIAMLDRVDGYTERKYHESFEKMIFRYRYHIYATENQLINILFRNGCRDVPFFMRIKLLIRGFVYPLILLKRWGRKICRK